MPPSKWPARPDGHTVLSSYRATFEAHISKLQGCENWDDELFLVFMGNLLRQWFIYEAAQPELNQVGLMNLLFKYNADFRSFVQCEIFTRESHPYLFQDDNDAF